MASTNNKSPRHLLTVSSFTKEEHELVLATAADIKACPSKYHNACLRMVMLLIFQKPSLRTHVSFEAGFAKMGGHAIYYSTVNSPMGSKETIHDTAKCASRFVEIIGARLKKKSEMHSLAKHATVPTINMLDDWGHPCQILADFLTIKEKKGADFSKLKLSYFGDSDNNVTYDLMRMCALFGMTMDVACPKDDRAMPQQDVLDEVAKLSETSGAKVRIVHNAMEAARDADILYTDSWVSYHIDASEKEDRIKLFTPFKVTQEVLKAAKDDAIFMNCLPADRNSEQTSEVIDGPQSVVFDQAENRMHAQNAIILFLLGQLPHPL